MTATLYTQTGNPFYQLGPDGATNGWSYYLDNRPKRQYLANGSFWQTTYNDVNLLATRTFYSAGGTALTTNVTGFDRRGNQILKIDALGNAFTSLFDGLDRVKVAAGPPIVTVSMGADLSSYVTNTVQQISTYVYDNCGKVLIVSMPWARSAITYFDVLGRVTDKEIHDATNNLVRITTTTYSADHQSQTVTEGSGSTAIVKTVYSDNENQPVLTISYPSAGVKEFVLDRYDLVENLISETHNTVSGAAMTTWTTAAFANDGLNRVTVQNRSGRRADHLRL